MGMGGPFAAAPDRAHVPLEQLADIKIVKGPTQIKSEAGMLAAYVYIDFSGRDVGGYVDEAKKRLASSRCPTATASNGAANTSTWENRRTAEDGDPAHP